MRSLLAQMPFVSIPMPSLIMAKTEANLYVKDAKVKTE